VRPRGPTFWLLDGPTGWRTAHADGVAVDAREGLRLQVDPAGIRAPDSADGSLGGLVAPRFAAVDGAGRVHLITSTAPHLRRYDRAADAFVGLLCAAGPGRRPYAVAAAGRDLVVVHRGSRRVVLLDTESLARRAVWGPDRGPTGQPRRPVAAAHGPGGWHVLDAQHGVVLRHRDPLGAPEEIRPAGTGPWRGLAVDREGRLHLLGPDGRLHVFSAQGAALGAVADSGEVADRFAAPALRTDHRGRLLVPGALLDPCGPWPAADGLFDRATGARTARADDEWVGPPEYRTRGTWIAGPLDSAIHRCPWHRVQLELGRLPAGARISVSTVTDARERTVEDLLALPEELWATVPDLVGPAAQQPVGPTTQRSGHEPPPPAGDVAVQSREGRFLWLRLRLHGDGHTTPTVRGIRVHYPRRSHLELLPAVYSADDAARRFTERFLALVATQVEPVEHLVRDMAALFDPAATPPVLVDVLSAWLGLPREGAWTVEQRRALLAAQPPILDRRGTPAALRTHVRAYLRTVTGLPLPDDGFPHLVEGFRERHHVTLTGRNAGALRGRVAVWSPGVVARLQVDRYATEGRVRLVTTGDPDRDVFHHYAHRFRVVVPAPWVRTADDERTLRRAIEDEKPAHTAYELALVPPGIRVGRQATVGLDTVIGALPRARLACRHDTGAAPSLPPRGRLGVDTVLCPAHPPRDVRLPARAGDGTALL
jgi:phage tail-like protein